MRAGCVRFDVTLVGETNLDLILRGLPPQMPLERELLASSLDVTLGGSSSILAHNLARLGSRVGFTTEIGGDPLGAVALGYLQSAGVHLETARRREDAQTGLTVLLPHGAERHILTYAGVMQELTVASLDREYLSDTRCFHLSSLFLQTGLHAGLPAFLRELRAAGVIVSLDTNDDPADTWGGVLHELLGTIDIFLPNADELMRITRRTTVEAALDVVAAQVPTVVVKCGRRGALLQHQGERHEIAAPFADVVDTIGAGDSFNAGFLHAFAAGASLDAAARFGCATGALSTQRAGGVQAFCEPELLQSVLRQR